MYKKAIHLHNDGASADEVRRMIASLTTDNEGVHSWDSFVVSENTIPDMSVNVSGGRAYIKGTEDTFQGTYFCESTSEINIVISAADISNARKDIIVVKIEDTKYTGSTDGWSIVVVNGTPSRDTS